MFWIQVIAALGVVLVTALVAAGRGDSLGGLVPRTPPRLPEDRPIGPSDVVDLRLGIALRGYRMDEVDDALDRLADEIASRDDEIAELRGLLASRTEVLGAELVGPATLVPSPGAAVAGPSDRVDGDGQVAAAALTDTGQPDSTRGPVPDHG